VVPVFCTAAPETHVEALGLPQQNNVRVRRPKGERTQSKRPNGQQKTVVGKETKNMLEKANAEWRTADPMDNWELV